MTKSYLIAKGIPEEFFKLFQEGKVIIFEMPPFCSGDYKAQIYKDDYGLYISKDDDFFSGCRDWEVYPKDVKVMIPTAQEFLYRSAPEGTRLNHNLDRDGNGYPATICEKAMIEFAKMHVKLALQSAVDHSVIKGYEYNSRTKELKAVEPEHCYWVGHPEDQSYPDIDLIIDDDSILNCYPENKIT